jgi:hypothetical protein
MLGDSSQALFNSFAPRFGHGRDDQSIVCMPRVKHPYERDRRDDFAQRDRMHPDDRLCRFRLG